MASFTVLQVADVLIDDRTKAACARAVAQVMLQHPLHADSAFGQVSSTLALRTFTTAYLVSLKFELYQPSPVKTATHSHSYYHHCSAQVT